MRRKKLRKTLMWLAPGCMLWLSCPSGSAEYLAPIFQPIIGQVLSEVAATFTSQLLGQLQP